MGTTQSSETLSFADFLRSQRTTTQAQVDARTKEHDKHDVPAHERFASVSGR